MSEEKVVRDLAWEGHIRAISVWVRLAGMAGVVFAVYGFLTLHGGGGEFGGLAAFGALLYLAALLVAGLFIFALGQGLWSHNDVARVIAIILLLLGALYCGRAVLLGFRQFGLLQRTTTLRAMVPFGTLLVWLVAVIWVLSGRAATRICSWAYRDRIRQDKHRIIPFYTSVFFFAPFAMIFISLALMWFTTSSEFSRFLSTHFAAITGVFPSSGYPETIVEIEGRFLSGSSSVTFNGTPAQFTIAGNDKILATVPSGATTGPIIVTTPRGAATSKSNFMVGPTPPPHISSITPVSAPVGKSVYIRGSFITGATAVQEHHAAWEG